VSSREGASGFATGSSVTRSREAGLLTTCDPSHVRRGRTVSPARASDVERGIGFRAGSHRAASTSFKTIDSDDQQVPARAITSSTHTSRRARKTAPPVASRTPPQPKAANGRVARARHVLRRLSKRRVENSRAGELEMDGTGETMNESGVRHLRVGSSEEPPLVACSSG